MKIAVTGAAGFLGRHVAAAAAAAGHEVTGVVRGSQRGAPPAPGSYREIQADLLDPPPDLAKQLSGTRVIVHAAARIRGPAEAVHRSIVHGTENVLRAMNALEGARLVYVSSLAVLEDGGGAYARAKREAEAKVRDSGVPYMILRPTLLYGPGDRGWTEKVRRAVQGPAPCVLPGWGRARIQPLYVEDAAAAVLAAAEGEASTVEAAVLPLAGPEPVPYGAFLRAVRAATGGRAPFIPIPLPLLRAAGLVDGRFRRAAAWYGTDHGVNIDAARRMLGFAPRGMKEGLARTFARREG